MRCNDEQHQVQCCVNNRAPWAWLFTRHRSPSELHSEDADAASPRRRVHRVPRRCAAARRRRACARTRIRLARTNARARARAHRITYRGTHVPVLSPRVTIVLVIIPAISTRSHVRRSRSEQCSVSERASIRGSLGRLPSVRTRTPLPLPLSSRATNPRQPSY